MQLDFAVGCPVSGLRHDDLVELFDARATGAGVVGQCGRHFVGVDCPGVHPGLLLLPCARLLESARMAVFQLGLELVGCPVGSLRAVAQPLDLSYRIATRYK